jgi:FkbM family methyltransferase
MLPAAIRKLSCNPTLRRVAGSLHISHFARRVYCRLLSNDGMLQVSMIGVTALFKSGDSKQIALVDYILTTERDFIEMALNDLREGETFLDVGCNYGIFSILASKVVGPKGRVISVDPYPKALEVLRGNIAANRCENVDVLNVAFSNRSGSLSLSYNDNGAALQTPLDAPSTVHTVPAMAGDEALHGVVPAAMKVDVEGHELAVLTGLKHALSSKACRRLCLEIHPTLLPSDVTEAGIMAFIKDCGFHILHESPRPPAIHVVATK